LLEETIKSPKTLQKFTFGFSLSKIQGGDAFEPGKYRIAPVSGGFGGAF
jgi:hypothetical protein